MIQLEHTSAQWAAYCMRERAADLRGAAVAARSRIKTVQQIRAAAEYVAETYERAAFELDRAAAGINHQFEGSKTP